MILLKTLFIVATLLLAQPVFVPGQTRGGLDRTAKSSIKTTRGRDGYLVVTTITRRFTYLDKQSHLLSPRTLLLLEEFHRDRTIGIEGFKGIVKVEGWFGPTLSNKAWTIEQDGDEGRVVSDELYRVTKFGCCSSLDTYFFFSLKTGQRVFSSTAENLSEVRVPNTGPHLSRYVAFHSYEAEIPALDTRPNDFRGLLQYGTSTKPLWKLAVYSKAQSRFRIKFRYDNKIVDSQSLDLWGANRKDAISSLSRFAIVLSSNSAGDIVLPITNDAPDLTKATIPPTFRVELIR